MEKSQSAHLAMTKALDETNERYGRLFDEKVALMVEGMKKGKKIVVLEV